MWWLQSLPHPDMWHHGLSHCWGPPHQAASARGTSPGLPGRGAPSQSILRQFSFWFQLQFSHHHSAASKTYSAWRGYQHFVSLVSVLKWLLMFSNTTFRHRLECEVLCLLTLKIIIFLNLNFKMKNEIILCLYHLVIAHLFLETVITPFFCFPPNLTTHFSLLLVLVMMTKCLRCPVNLGTSTPWVVMRTTGLWAQLWTVSTVRSMGKVKTWRWRQEWVLRWYVTLNNA